MKVSKFIAKYLEKQGVTQVFEMSGGMITYMLDSIYLENKIKIMSNHHEQASAFAADGFARMNGIPGVAFATSGPGATNLITGIGSCYFDSTPAVFITGQVNTYEQKGNLSVRQLGFQETDIVSIVTLITKAAYKVKSAEDVPMIFEEAFLTALSGRRGPVLIDIPMDLQRVELPEDLVERFLTKKVVPKIIDIQESDIDKFYIKFLEVLNKSKNPLILVGGGIRSGESHSDFMEFINKIGIPVVHSLMGVDVLSYNNPLRVGMIGSYGNRFANIAIAESDLVLVLGSRLDIRQTGGNIESFKEGKVFFHVDCDVGELNNKVKGCITLHADLSVFFDYVNNHDQKIIKNENIEKWLAHLLEIKVQWADIDELKACPGINPNILMHQISEASKNIKAYIVDVGQHQMWAAQSLEIKAHQRFLTSGGLGSMGFALPASIGATLAMNEKVPVMVIVGDGGFQVNIQELETIKNNQLPIKIIILNNKAHGMVRQFQESYFNSRFQSTVWGYSTPSFSKISSAYEIESKTISDPGEVEDALTWLNKDLKKASVLEILIDSSINVYPKLAFGKKFGDMEPQVKPTDM